MCYWCFAATFQEFQAIRSALQWSVYPWICGYFTSLTMFWRCTAEVLLAVCPWKLLKLLIEVVLFPSIPLLRSEIVELQRCVVFSMVFFFGVSGLSSESPQLTKDRSTWHPNPSAQALHDPVAGDDFGLPQVGWDPPWKVFSNMFFFPRVWGRVVF